MVDSIDVLVVAVAVLYTLFVVLSIWRDYRQCRTARYGNWTMVRRFRDSEGTEIAVFRWKMRYPLPGWREFTCDSCHEQWKTSARDCHSPSAETCRCGEEVHPSNSYADGSLELDRFGNVREFRVYRE